jgi:short-subunit dehydrogenase
MPAVPLKMIVPARSHKQRRWAEKYGPWTVVTGASDGIGREIATLLAEAGLNLVLVARRQDALEALASDLGARHEISARIVVADLGQAEGVAKVLAATGELDVGLLVAAAGFATSGRFIDIPVGRELDMVQVNCSAVVGVAHHFAQRFAKRGSGGIIFFSSLLAFQGVPKAANYAATKAYIQTLAEGLHAELGPLGVDVIAAAPGPVRTGFEARANLRTSAAGSPVVAARQTLAALGHRTTVRPGFLSKFLEASLLPLPRWGRVRIMSLVMGGMTQHQDGIGKGTNIRPA